MKKKLVFSIPKEIYKIFKKMNGLLKLGKYYYEPTLVGKGSFGKVYKCYEETDLEQKYPLAMKIYPGAKNELLLHEVSLGRKFDFQHVLKQYPPFEDQGQTIGIFEFCSKGNMEEYILQNPQLTEEQRVDLFGQIVCGFCHIVRYLKAEGRIFQHRDIKPQNILINNEGVVKIIDLGESRIREVGMHSECTMQLSTYGSPNYYDPRMIWQAGYHYKSDIWSLGVTFYYILFAKLPYDQQQLSKFQGRQSERRISIENTFKKYFENEIHLQDLQMSDKVRNCLKKMLDLSIETRYDWEGLFVDPLVSSYTSQVAARSSSQIKPAKKIDDILQNQEFLSSTFQSIHGDQLWDTIQTIVFKGTIFTKAALMLKTLFLENKVLYDPAIKSGDQIADIDPRHFLLKNWIIFEKALHSLQFKSYIYFYGCNKLFSVENEQNFQRERLNAGIDDHIWDVLKSNDQTRKRIQDQFYQLYDDVRKQFIKEYISRMFDRENYLEYENYKFDFDIKKWLDQQTKPVVDFFKLNLTELDIEVYKDETVNPIFNKCVFDLLDLIMIEIEYYELDDPQHCCKLAKLAADLILILTMSENKSKFRNFKVYSSFFKNNETEQIQNLELLQIWITKLRINQGILKLQLN